MQLSHLDVVEGRSSVSRVPSREAFFDWKNERFLTRAAATPFAKWVDGAPGAFAWHSEGFAVFLSPLELGKFDEYEAHDPYGVGGAGMSSFHEWRLQCSLELLDAVLTREPSVRVLDIGCGEGHFTARLRRRFPHVRAAGLDASLSAIRTAARSYPDIAWVVANAYEPPFAPSSFDVVLCNNLWEHVPDPLRLLSGITRCLRPGGYVLVSTPSRYRVANVLRVLRGRQVSFMSKHHVTEYTVGQVREQLRYAGFELVTEGDPPAAPRGERVRRRLLRAPLRWWKTLSRSHHVFEGTSFVLAKSSSNSFAIGE